MNSYLLIAADGATVIREIHRERPLDKYNTRARSAQNGKPFILKATVRDVTADPATEVREGPEYKLLSTRADIVYTLRAKTPDELAEDVRSAALNALGRSDSLDMGRITEDLIDVLVAAGVIALTDLPQPSQDKLAERKRNRDAL